MKRSANRPVFETVSSTYTVLEQIGCGGSGTVVKVQDDDDQILAIKYLSPEHAGRKKNRRFRNEINFCLNHTYPHVLLIKDLGFVVINEKKCPFYVMPLYDGTLKKLIATGMPADKILLLFSQILDGVEAAHLNKVWHRDIKPENILYDSGRENLVVADFGIAHFNEEQMATMVKTGTGDRLANFQYAAPEQRVENLPVDHRADIFALGMILNEMFTKNIPHGTRYETIGAVSPKHMYLDALVEKMLAQKPDDRFQSIGEVKRDLIARGNQYIQEQRLSELRGAVIPKYEMDDPLVCNPVTLSSAKWNNNILRLILSQPVNVDWMRIFQQPSSYRQVLNRAPGNFVFSIRDGETTIQCNGGEAKVLKEYFKELLLTANTGYKAWAEREMRQKRAADEAALKRKLEQAQIEYNVNRDLNV